MLDCDLSTDDRTAQCQTAALLESLEHAFKDDSPVFKTVYEWYMGEIRRTKRDNVDVVVHNQILKAEVLLWSRKCKTSQNSANFRKGLFPSSRIYQACLKVSSMRSGSIAC